MRVRQLQTEQTQSYRVKQTIHHVHHRVGHRHTRLWIRGGMEGEQDAEFVALFDLLPAFNQVLQAVESAETPDEVAGKVNALQGKIAAAYAALDDVDRLADAVEEGKKNPTQAVQEFESLTADLCVLRDSTLPSLTPSNTPSRPS